ncbi:hypothetical protein FA15DRAFT_711604 [Coprinopsis marcescibilis]|uniref:CCHC-type domain-containing protein n=1 Tax=Coprinopsis marcescibilis TaxID=230819 RepID=A0A5C3K9L6_COPMA|nr:hypothetical protein FA15DRAFT_711604 [Coprinopsis marcescibilis]
MHAARWGSTSVVKLLLERRDINVNASPKGKSALELAMEQGHAKVVEMLLSSTITSPTSTVVAIDKPPICKELIHFFTEAPNSKANDYHVDSHKPETCIKQPCPNRYIQFITEDELRTIRRTLNIAHIEYPNESNRKLIINYLSTKPSASAPSIPSKPSGSDPKKPKDPDVDLSGSESDEEEPGSPKKPKSDPDSLEPPPPPPTPPLADIDLDSDDNMASKASKALQHIKKLKPDSSNCAIWFSCIEHTATSIGYQKFLTTAPGTDANDIAKDINLINAIMTIISDLIYLRYIKKTIAHELITALKKDFNISNTIVKAKSIADLFTPKCNNKSMVSHHLNCLTNLQEAITHTAKDISNRQFIDAIISTIPKRLSKLASNLKCSYELHNQLNNLSDSAKKELTVLELITYIQSESAGKTKSTESANYTSNHWNNNNRSSSNQGQGNRCSCGCGQGGNSNYCSNNSNNNNSNSSSGSSNKSSGKCHNCGSTGHWANKCPSPKQHHNQANSADSNSTNNSSSSSSSLPSNTNNNNNNTNNNNNNNTNNNNNSKPTTGKKLDSANYVEDPTRFETLWCSLPVNNDLIEDALWELHQSSSTININNLVNQPIAKIPVHLDKHAFHANTNHSSDEKTEIFNSGCTCHRTPH